LHAAGQEEEVISYLELGARTGAERLAPKLPARHPYSELAKDSDALALEQALALHEADQLRALKNSDPGGALQKAA
jgi:hypothetical protein